MATKILNTSSFLTNLTTTTEEIRELLRRESAIDEYLHLVNPWSRLDYYTGYLRYEFNNYSTLSDKPIDKLSYHFEYGSHSTWPKEVGYPVHESKGSFYFRIQEEFRDSGSSTTINFSKCVWFLKPKDYENDDPFKIGVLLDPFQNLEDNVISALQDIDYNLDIAICKSNTESNEYTLAFEFPYQDTTLKFEIRVEELESLTPDEFKAYVAGLIDIAINQYDAYNDIYDQLNSVYDNIKQVRKNIEQASQNLGKSNYYSDMAINNIYSLNHSLDNKNNKMKELLEEITSLLKNKKIRDRDRIDRKQILMARLLSRMDEKMMNVEMNDKMNDKMNMEALRILNEKMNVVLPEID